MAVILFKKGTGAPQKFDEYLFESSLSSGWCLTKEKALKPDKPEEAAEPEVVVEEEVIESAEEVHDITDGLSNKQIRTMAKDVGIKNYKKARINKLKEALNDA